MNLRFALVACLATVLVAYVQSPASLLLSFSEPFAWSLLGLCFVGLLGGFFSFLRGEPWLFRWRLAWLSMIALLWLLCVGDLVWVELSPVSTLGPTVLRRLQPFAITTTLLLGYLVMLKDAAGASRGEMSLPLILLMPGFLAVMILAISQGGSLYWLPALASTGFLPWRASSPDAGDDRKGSVWITCPAMIVELLSLQSVGWGAVLSVLGCLTEVLEGQYLTGLIMGFGTGFTAWIGSGLLWGLAESFRQGRFRVAPLVRLLFGRQAAEL